MSLSTVPSPTLGPSNRRRSSGRRMRIAEDVLCDTPIAILKANRGVQMSVTHGGMEAIASTEVSKVKRGLTGM